MVLMVTNSLYSITSPFIWLSSVYNKDSVLDDLFNAATSLFYATNTFFACLMLYVVHYFYLDI